MLRAWDQFGGWAGGNFSIVLRVRVVVDVVIGPPREQRGERGAQVFHIDLAQEDGVPHDGELRPRVRSLPLGPWIDRTVLAEGPCVHRRSSREERRLTNLSRAHFLTEVCDC